MLPMLPDRRLNSDVQDNRAIGHYLMFTTVVDIPLAIDELQNGTVTTGILKGVMTFQYLALSGQLLQLDVFNSTDSVGNRGEIIQ